MEPEQWARCVGYLADRPVRIIPLATGCLATRDGDRRGLRMNPAACRELVGLASGRVLLGQIERPEGPGQRRVLDALAGIGLLRRLAEPERDALPSVAVVVPAHGRAAGVARCVGSILDLDYPSDRLQVLVVDDASGDGGLTARTAEAAGARVVALDANVGPGSARNAGARASRSTILAFVDTDCVVERNWLVEAVAELADPQVAAVAGRVRIVRTPAAISAYEQLQSPLDVGPEFGDLDSESGRFFCPAANFVIRREAFERVGGFDPGQRLGEDVDLCLRLLYAGHRIRLRPDLTVWHDAPVDVTVMAGRRFFYGRGEASLWGRHPITRQGVLLSFCWLGLLGAVAAAVSKRPLPARTALAVTGLILWSTQSAVLAIGRSGSPGELPLEAAIKNLSRYQAAPLLAVETVLRRSTPVFTLGLLVAAGLVERGNRNPKPKLLPWLAFHAVEDLAYSAGWIRGLGKALSPDRNRKCDRPLA